MGNTEVRSVRLVLIVKGEREVAEAEVARRLNDWFLEDIDQKGEDGYPRGSLLHWRMSE